MLTDDAFRRKLKRAKKRKTRREQLSKYKNQKQASKLYAIFLFGSCTVIEVCTLIATFIQLDLAREAIIYGYAYEPQLSPLVALIGTVISEVVAYAIYVVRAKGEDHVQIEQMKNSFSEESAKFNNMI